MKVFNKQEIQGQIRLLDFCVNSLCGVVKGVGPPATTCNLLITV